MNSFFVASLFCLDQLIKHFMRTRLALGESFVHFGPFGIAHFENTAGPFSLPIPFFFLLSIHTVVLAAILLAFLRLPSYRTGLLWILAGGLSNLLDRVFFASTTDYIALPFGGFWNIADVMVMIGILILLFSKPTSPQAPLDSSREA